MEFLILAIVIVILLAIYRPFDFSVQSFARRKRNAQLRMVRLKIRGEADEVIQQKLIAKLDGDREAAERLVARQRFGKAGKYSENYYWQLAIDSLDNAAEGDAPSAQRPVVSSGDSQPFVSPISSASQWSFPSGTRHRLWEQFPWFPNTPFGQRRKRARLRMRQLRARGEASEWVQARLIRLLDGDREAAERLVARQRFGKRGRYSEDDYWLQAIRGVEHQQSESNVENQG